MIKKLPSALVSTGLSLFSMAVSLGVVEVALRIKNRDMKNYAIEMWRYSKELKTRSQNGSLGHEHLPNRTALLQSVSIRTNEWGLRGPSLSPSHHPTRRILFLGASVTLGWGVQEEDTLSAQIANKFREKGQDVEVLNGGIGNYNTKRYVTLFQTRLKELHPTDVVVQYFLRDAEYLEAGNNNWLLRNSQLAVLLWNILQQSTMSRENSLIDHYRAVYADGSKGRREMEMSLNELADYCHARKIRLYFAMTPDFHYLRQYPFGAIHDLMKNIAAREGYRYVDLYPSVSDLDAAEVWAMPSDPHPNALGHRRMASALFPILEQTSATYRELAGRGH